MAHFENFSCSAPLGYLARLDDAAQRAGEKRAAFIRRAIDERIKRMDRAAARAAAKAASAESATK